ncbi:aldo/keto reductase [Hoeflea prorocentri]|uniref:Aldo/keto reductase n=1 Tax=Hoeflea prorocentri TaxID=1922333 RepID=A0A9X3UF56_9HYPH|nr:aldo/keto reductase [Hoeflea prorocentri]MCY6379750.1 aldo/keto reductase [Hoeflea prorocentri]MDA5397550.1 aldo/keto reductase [Hoeflea prorocentri]
MKRRAIGNTGLEVTELCFGTSPLADMPDTYGYGVDEERARATVRAIFDSPVNFLDTSRNYGFGRAEERIGAVIRERGGLPDGFVLSTKLDRNMETNRFDASCARQSFEESLEALSLDRVQVLHLHDPEHSASLEEITGPGGALDELFKIKEEGLADAVGLAMGRIDIMFPLLRDRPFDVLINHNRFTLLNRQADEMYDYAHEAGIAILNAAPYAGGVLAKGSVQMPKLTYQDASHEALEPVRLVEAACARHGLAPGVAALDFSMSDPRITSTIVGVSKPERVAQTIEWATQTIPDAARQELAGLPYSTEDPEANRDYTPG